MHAELLLNHKIYILAFCRSRLRETNLVPTPNPLKVKTFSTSSDLSAWLEINHTNEAELWIKIFKKNTQIQSVRWNDVVIEALCWGWIDGIKKSIDDQAYLQRITPRTKRSKWSKRNTEHVERLINEGRMKESGLTHVRAAKSDGRWDSAYVVSKLEVPLDFIAALESQPKAKEFYGILTKSNRYVIALGLTSAKKADTREKRFKQYMKMLNSDEKPK